jgi:SAM-dependent methyltransferase
LHRCGGGNPEIINTGFRVYSQFEEDGMLLYIFSLIGFTNRKVLDVCIGNGRMSNIANLIINHGCYGLGFDGSIANVEVTREFFRNIDSLWFKPKIERVWITKDNINRLVKDCGDWEGNIDFFSLDIDGNDYWIWDALDIVSPRVFMCETRNFCPDDESITIPYREDFYHLSPENYHEHFYGVSSLAMIKLSNRKGYRLIGANKYGSNLIFMRNDVGIEVFEEISLDTITEGNQFIIDRKRKLWPELKDAPWVKV